MLNQILLMGSQPQDGQGGGLLSFLPFILIILIIYFLMIRPQAKKAKQQNVFRESLKRGDKIVTIGGVHARILEIYDNSILIDAGNNVRLTIEKSAVSMEASAALSKDTKELK
jgi:preprotein translocase subunit YajC